MVDGGFPFPMLSDAGGKWIELWSVRCRAGVDVRGRFIIDPDGIIQAIEILTPPVGRKVSESIRQLQAFQHVRKTKCRSLSGGWEPGMPTLKVSPDLAGKCGSLATGRVKFADSGAEQTAPRTEAIRASPRCCRLVTIANSWPGSTGRCPCTPRRKRRSSTEPRVRRGSRSGRNASRTGTSSGTGSTRRPTSRWPEMRLSA